MKAGILTTYFATNYGAMLQPYALKKTLEQKGLEVEIIRYKQNKVYNTYKPFNFKTLRNKSFLGAIKYIFEYPIRYKKASNFRIFQYKYLNNKKGFSKIIPKDKDFYFLGSDQIWNPTITNGFDDVYFGNFITKKTAKKISYAASAEDIIYNENTINYLKRNLSNLDYISVRENKLAEILTLKTGIKDIKTVLDPTLIADSNIYKEINHIKPINDAPFILFYMIRNCKDFIPKILQFSRENKCKLLILSSWYDYKLTLLAKKNKDIIYLPTAGVEIFLGAIKYAKCIFTPSFHGCAFSILYHKKFYSLKLNDNWNTRVKDLLDSLLLSKRIIGLDDEINLNDNINYEDVEINLNKLRYNSHQFINKAIENEQI